MRERDWPWPKEGGRDDWIQKLKGSAKDAHACPCTGAMGEGRPREGKAGVGGDGQSGGGGGGRRHLQ